jgi:uncharacterized protein (PEP-CTERM system associated)
MMRRIGMERWIVFLIAVPLIVSIGESRANAATLFATPSLSVDESWDSNVFNTPTQEESDFIFRVIPRLTLSVQTSYTTVSLTGGYEFDKYADHDELDSNSATKDINLTASGPIRLSPRFSILPSALYVETEDLTRRNRFTQAPSPVLAPSDVVVTTRTKSRDYRAALLMTYQATPTLDVSVGGGVAKRDFIKLPVGATQQDSRTVTGDASISYRFSPRFSSGIFFNASFNDYDTSPSTSAYTSGLSGDYKISELFDLSARAGATYLETDAGGTSPKSEDWFPFGRIAIGYSKQSFRATIDGSYTVTAAGSFGDTTKNTTIAIALSDRFFVKWEWNLAGYYQKSRSATKPITQDVSTTTGTAGIRYKPVLWASVGISGEILRQNAKTGFGNDVDRDSVTLDVTLSKPYKLY